MPVDVVVPPLGTNVDVLTLIAWYRREGESVVKDEPLFALETDKARLDVEAPASGILCRVCAEPGDGVAALSRIATIRRPEEADPFNDQTSASMERMNASGKQSCAAKDTITRRVQSRPQSASDAEGAHPISTPRPTSDGRIFISPRAKRLAELSHIEWQLLTGTGPENAIVERDVVAVRDSLARQAAIRPKTASPVAQRMAASEGIDWTHLSGSGPGGKVVREDVNRVLDGASEPEHVAASAPERVTANAPEQLAASERTASSEEDSAELLETIPLSGIRGVIASRMMQSAASTAPVTLTAQADATSLVQLRAQLSEDGLAVSYNALLLKILARALKEHPRLNASLEGEVIHVWRNVHIGLAVDSEQGLRVPVVRHVERKGLQELENDIRDVAQAARDGKVSPQTLRGGTFTLTNLGMYGIAAFTPVINLPECAILGVGQIKPEPTVVGEQIVIRQRMWLSLTFDHRLVDGGPAARFLQRVVQLIEKPYLLHG